MNEAVYEGVPILGIPFWVDQTLNIKSVQAAGVAEMLEYPKISSEEVLSKIKKILNDDRYVGGWPSHFEDKTKNCP